MGSKKQQIVKIEEEFRGAIDQPEEAENRIITRSLDVIEKPLEVFYEQIAKRNATGLASVEKTEEKRQEWFEKFYQELVQLKIYSGWPCSLRCRC